MALAAGDVRSRLRSDRRSATPRTLTDGDRATLEAIPNLAPGDFRTVRQSLRYLGESADNAALRDESNAKRLTARSGGQGHIGF